LPAVSGAASGGSGTSTHRETEPAETFEPNGGSSAEVTGETAAGSAVEEPNPDDVAAAAPVAVVSVIVHLAGGLEDTVACLSALAENTPDDVPFQTILVDDATADGTDRFLQGLSGDLVIQRHDPPVGFATAVNHAVAAARAPLLLLLDAGTVVRPGWLVPLLERLTADPSVAAVQPRVTTPEGRLRSTGGARAGDGRPLLRGLGSPWPDDPALDRAEAPAFLDGACLVVRRAAFEDVAGIDPAYPDGVSRFAELGLALRQRGAALAYEPRATVESRRRPDLQAGSRRLMARWPVHIPTPRVRSIAFYLPQFHPVAENDRWWGLGFTDWTDVTRATPRFEGHEQPHLPAELGFYDLRLPETRAAQAELARAHGIDAFCYFHYWFEGRRLLRRPIDEVLSSGQPDFPFCLCWANGDWRRNRDGRGGETLMAQGYSEADDRAHIAWLLPVFRDPRYVRVEGKPLFLVYRAADLPDAAATTERWRQAARRQGVGELFLCRVESFPEDRTDPRPLGFDAAAEFQPDWSVLGPLPQHGGVPHPIYDYGQAVRAMLDKEPVPWRRIPAVCPRWDNTPKNPTTPLVLHRSSPELYGTWVENVTQSERAQYGDEAMLFVNAWNEWGQGAHLEPCQRWQRRYLEAHRDGTRAPSRPPPETSVGVCVTGMHRSGTSLTASWLERCGVPVYGGGVAGAATGDPYRPVEDFDFLRVNETAIDRQWPAAQGWKVVDDAPCHLSGPALDAALAVVARRRESLAQWAWRDPRSTLLLESWAEVVPGMRALLLWRPCTEVVESLADRSSPAHDPFLAVDMETAVRIWIAYNRRIADYRRLYPDRTVLVRTASVVSRSSEVHELLRHKLGLQIEYRPVGELVDPSMLLSTADIDVGPWAGRIAETERRLADLSDA
jgi:glycosyltransferase involved in cell wall biosynthesis